MPGNLNLGMYFCTAKKETLRIVPQQVLAMQLDTVQLTYPVFMQKKIPHRGAGILLCLNICLLVELFFACAKSVLVCAFADDTTGHNHIVSHIFVLIVS